MVADTLAMEGAKLKIFNQKNYFVVSSMCDAKVAWANILGTSFTRRQLVVILCRALAQTPFLLIRGNQALLITLLSSM